MNEKLIDLLIWMVQNKQHEFDSALIDQYVIVRCRDAGVHAGTLESHNGRQCVLINSRRLWYWKPKTGMFLSGIAVNGLDRESKIGTTVERLLLTENCEIILCTDQAAESIKSQPDYE